MYEGAYIIYSARKRNLYINPILTRNGSFQRQEKFLQKDKKMARGRGEGAKEKNREGERERKHNTKNNSTLIASDDGNNLKTLRLRF